MTGSKCNDGTTQKSARSDDTCVWFFVLGEYGCDDNNAKIEHEVVSPMEWLWIQYVSSCNADFRWFSGVPPE